MLSREYAKEPLRSWRVTLLLPKALDPIKQREAEATPKRQRIVASPGDSVFGRTRFRYYRLLVKTVEAGCH